MAKPAPMTIATEPIGSIPRPVVHSQENRKRLTGGIPTSLLSTKMPFETLLNGLKPKALLRYGRPSVEVQ